MAYTKFDAVKELIRATLQPDDYLIATPSAASPTTVEFSAYKNLWPDAHWQNGEVIIANGTLESRRIIDFDAPNCLITVNSPFSTTPSGEIAVVRSWKTLEQYESALRAAFSRLAPFFAYEERDERHILHRDQNEYEIPETWLYIDDVLIDEGGWTGDGFLIAGDGEWIGLNDNSARQRLAQKFETNAHRRITSVFLRVKNVGAPTGTMTIQIAESSGSGPGAVIASGTMTIGNETGAGWNRAEIPGGAWVEPNTAYWIVVIPSYSTSAANHVRLLSGTGYRWNGARHDGLAWTEIARSFEYRLVAAEDQHWRKLYSSSWDVSRGDKPLLRLRRLPIAFDGSILRMDGRALPVFPSQATDEIRIEQSVLIAVARAEAYFRMARDTGDMQRVAAALEEGERLLRKLRARGKPTSVAVRS